MVAREIGSDYSCTQAIPTLLFMRRIIIRQQKITRGAGAKLAIFRIFFHNKAKRRGVQVGRRAGWMEGQPDKIGLKSRSCLWSFT